ncbi:hypothetical protein SAMN05660865_01217 [Caloramator fervidus]|uniref:Uncharacterized protein n=1 Tax=Caloramator fervidus TaxID=29344 RepID=A0A1H5VKK8_9CLOT|nr:hypothetical protein [Caloramator fervidus]SEF87087.1 hypothetical protein SAMN05660865_01217 [Caloramator fervidus]
MKVLRNILFLIQMFLIALVGVLQFFSKKRMGVARYLIFKNSLFENTVFKAEFIKFYLILSMFFLLLSLIVFYKLKKKAIFLIILNLALILLLLCKTFNTRYFFIIILLLDIFIEVIKLIIK